MTRSLRDSLCGLVNQKVIIYAGKLKYCVVITQVCECYLKAIEMGTGYVKIFNLDRIDYVEDFYS